MVDSNLDKVVVDVSSNIESLFDELLHVKKEVNQLTVVNKNLQATVDNREADLAVLKKQAEEFISQIEAYTAERDALKEQAEQLAYTNKEFESVLERHQKELVELRKENRYLRSTWEADQYIIRGKQKEVYQLQELLKETHNSYAEELSYLRTKSVDTSLLDAKEEKYQALLSDYNFLLPLFKLKQAEVLKLQNYIAATGQQAAIDKRVEENLKIKKDKLIDWRITAFRNMKDRAEKDVAQLQILLKAKMDEVYSLQSLVKDNQKAYTKQLSELKAKALDQSELEAKEYEIQSIRSAEYFLKTSLKQKQAEVYRLQNDLATQGREALIKKLEVQENEDFLKWQLSTSKDLKNQWEKEAIQLETILKAKMNELYQLQSLSHENWKDAAELGHQVEGQQQKIDALEQNQLTLEDTAITSNAIDSVPASLYIAKQEEVYRLQALNNQNWKESAENKNEKNLLTEKFNEAEEQTIVLEITNEDLSTSESVPTSLYLAKQNEVYALQSLVKGNHLEARAKFLEKKTNSKTKVAKLKGKNAELKHRLAEGKKALVLSEDLLKAKQVEVYRLQELVQSNYRISLQKKLSEKEEVNVVSTDSTEVLLNEVIADKKQLERHLIAKLQEVYSLQHLVTEKGKDRKVFNSDFDSNDEELEFLQLELEELKEKLEDRIEENNMLWELAEQAKLKLSSNEGISVNSEVLKQENQEVNSLVENLTLDHESEKLATNLQESTKTQLSEENESVNDFQYRSNFTRIVESLGGEEGDPKKLTEAIDNYIQQIDHCIKYIDRLI
ncbi:hypothetical protein BC781_1011395 [Sediminitomix flava]|uniref:Uncharacterized protein n=2 Tax=Sediminitomix flava TaxID=379075 RepID=A0A316A5F5_SEDFL|nr:hypothetical protein BC781_1011395 [Sediminitomix flava]